MMGAAKMERGSCKVGRDEIQSVATAFQHLEKFALDI